MLKTKTLAFEIGTEEIPAFDLAKATTQLETQVAEMLKAARIAFERIEVYSTPRRLIVLVFALAEQTDALAEEHKGPAVSLAFDDAGSPTKAALGFAKGKGVEVGALERRRVGDTEYVFALKQTPAQKVAPLLGALLEKLIVSISWPKSCRWGSETAFFSRPVRWLLALLDDEVIPVNFAGLCAGNTTRGHRFLAPGPHEVSHANKLLDVLSAASVMYSQEQRTQTIRSGIAAVEREYNLVSELPANTLLEVVNLTEYPSVLVGSFDEAFLKVPEEIIVDALLKHQRYFPLYDSKHKLTNRFIAVSNGNPDCAAIIVAGNERVVRPRLSDAKFFYEEDLKRPLDYFVARLDTVVFQESLGTMRAKTERIAALVEHLCVAAKLSEEDTTDARRAAYLCKADLVSNAVVEFTSVQGIMGAYYARAAGENEQVAEAIAEHYRPRFADDAPARLTVSRLLAFADKLDTICGLFAVGQGPTGSSDPFALRRGAIGIITMLDDGLGVGLYAAIELALDNYGALVADKEAVAQEVAEFFVTRTKVILRERGYSPDVIDAVLAVGIVEPAQIIARVRALSAISAELPEAMEDLATAYARANNLADKTLGSTVDLSLLQSAETALLDALQKAEVQVSGFLAENDFAQTLEALAALRTPIDTFFIEVLIMDKDEALKNNRLRLLNRFVEVFSPIADFGKMAKTQRTDTC
ncbi:MAG: glycine--tRNA ligase subunit beta [Eggerthellaceae bacterium]|nr:glycine--tRNA ligase subunit beta [Eggerthellaceae bacterium]